jgi:polyhydroxybutyrate depolymerase
MGQAKRDREIFMSSGNQMSPPTTPADPTTGFSVTEWTVPVGARQRTMLVCVPEAQAPPTGWPLVLAFHGGRSHPDMMRRFSGLDILAATDRAVVVYPAGTGTRESMLTWNGGNCCGEARDGQSDDVGFVRELLTALSARLAIDPARIHATGMSNGAMMAYRVGAELADTIASIAPVAGPLALETISLARPVPLIHFHGSLDQFTPLEGGVGRRSVTRTHHRAILAGLLEWVRAGNGAETPRKSPLPCTDAGMTIERWEWGSAGAGNEVVWYRVEGAGHTWPGRVPDSFYLGSSALSLPANEIIWEFFAAHPLPARAG